MTTLTYDAIASASRRQLQAMLREVKARQATLLPLARKELRYTVEDACVERCKLSMAQHDIEARLRDVPPMRPVGGKGISNAVARLRANRRAT